jgi:hypothetical protein
MQIDFHHTVIYVLARLADFSREDAALIAHASQYVDDAVNAGTIRFDNKALYHRIASAHKMLDYRNFKELANARVWVPFHFLPGNEVRDEDRDLVSDYVQRLICRPNSSIAQQMMRNCIADQDSPHALYRLGISLHTYVDTWAHQGFAGLDHEVNHVREILDWSGAYDEEKMAYVQKFFGRNIFERFRDRVVSLFVSEVAPVGHGAVLGFPDRPYLRWKYRDWRGRLIERDNPRDFMDAADHAFTMLKAYKRGKWMDHCDLIPSPDRELIDHLLSSIALPDGRERHYSWLQAIREGKFSFGPETISYEAKGHGSWKHQALGTAKAFDDHDDIFAYNYGFLQSHWKLFHDALLHHRYVILHELLAAEEICAA